MAMPVPAHFRAAAVVPAGEEQQKRDLFKFEDDTAFSDAAPPAPTPETELAVVQVGQQPEPVLATTDTTSTGAGAQYAAQKHDAVGKDSEVAGVKNAAKTQPTSDNLRSCRCMCVRQLCCNPHVDPDDLILLKEKEHLSHFLQPLKEEKEIWGTEKCKNMAIDACLCPMGCKKPASCGSVSNNRGFTYVYPIWQLAVLIWCWLLTPVIPLPGGVLDAFNILLCTRTIHMDDRIGNALDSIVEPMYCPSVQQALRTSNYTKEVIGYPGAFKTMRALRWYSSVDYYFNGTHYNDSRVYARSDDTFVLVNQEKLDEYNKLEDLRWSYYWDEKDLDLYLEKVEKVIEDGTDLGTGIEIPQFPPNSNSSNSSQLYFALNFGDAENNLDVFVWLRGWTQSRLPQSMTALQVILFGVFLICCFVSFSLRFYKDGPNGLMYPARLEIKRTTSDKTVEYHFVRPRKLLSEFVLWFQIVNFGLGFMFFGFRAFNFLSLTTYTITFPSAGAVVGISIGGIIVQVNNATTLSNILAIILNKKNAESWSTPKFRERFKEWKELYKTSVGALHVWSWRMTPILGSMLLLIFSELLLRLVYLIAMYTAVMSEIDIPEPDRYEFLFLQVQSSFLEVLSVSLMLLIFIYALAKASSQYKKLDLLVATAKLPEHHLDDFKLLQKRKAAVTIFDFPITAETTATFLKIFLIKVSVLAYAALA